MASLFMPTSHHAQLHGSDSLLGLRGCGESLRLPDLTIKQGHVTRFWILQNDY